MTLHSFARTTIPSRWNWYTARQTRDGRIHLLNVPYFHRSPDQHIVPSHWFRIWSAEQQRQWQEHQALLPIVPFHVTPDLAIRFCKTKQNVRTWRHASGPRQNYHGICDACFFYWKDIVIGADILENTNEGEWQKVAFSQTALHLDTSPTEWRRLSMEREEQRFQEQLIRQERGDRYY